MDQWEYTVFRLMIDARKPVESRAWMLHEMPPDGNFQSPAAAQERAVLATLNALGAEGWELAGTAEMGFLIFKRRKPQAQP